jgi:hypothetical protein
VRIRAASPDLSANAAGSFVIQIGQLAAFAPKRVPGRNFCLAQYHQVDRLSQDVSGRMTWVADCDEMP